MTAPDPTLAALDAARDFIATFACFESQEVGLWATQEAWVKAAEAFDVLDGDTMDHAAARLEWAANDAATLRALADQIAALQPPGEEVAQPPHDTPARTVYVFGEPVARTETGCGCSGDYADPDCKYGCWDRVAPQDTATPDRPSAAQIAENLRNWTPPHGDNPRYA